MCSPQCCKRGTYHSYKRQGVELAEEEDEFLEALPDPPVEEGSDGIPARQNASRPEFTSRNKRNRPRVNYKQFFSISFFFKFSIIFCVV